MKIKNYEYEIGSLGTASTTKKYKNILKVKISRLQIYII